MARVLEGATLGSVAGLVAAAPKVSEKRRQEASDQQREVPRNHCINEEGSLRKWILELYCRFLISFSCSSLLEMSRMRNPILRPDIVWEAGQTTQHV